MKKRIGVFVLMLSFLVCFTCAAACSKPVDESEVLSRIEITTNPTKSAYFAGDAFDKTGLVVTAIYSGKTTKVVTDLVTLPTQVLVAGQTAVVASFTEAGITKTAEIAVSVTALTSSDKITIPQSNLTVLAGVAQSQATANYYVEYGDTTLDITVITLDSTIKSEESIFTGDNVNMYVGIVQRLELIPAGTLHIVVAPNGKHIVESYSHDDDFSELTDGEIVITSTYFTLAGIVDEGYKTTVKIPYTKLNVTADDSLNVSVDNKIATICAGVTNAAGGGVVNTSFSTAFGEDNTKANTFATITDNNIFAQNEWFQMGKTFGDAGALKAKTSWDVSGDDGVAKSIKMTDSIGDNNIYMYRESAPVLFATAKFTLNELFYGEKAAKFGLTVVTQSGDGFMYYIGADVDVAGKITGTALGYAKLSSLTSWLNFDVIGGIKNANEYQGENSVELSIYRQNEVFVLYYNGVEVRKLSGMPGIAFDTAANVGIVSFKAGLTVKDYSVTSDAEQLESKKIVQENKEFLFFGDSYVDRGFWQTFNAEYANISAENMGIGGTKADYWVDMLGGVKTLYNPSNIIVHVGINDINGGTTAEVLIAKLKDLFAAYQTTFPDVKIYYISLNPNAFVPTNWEKCQQVNAEISLFMEDDQNLNFIDFATTLGNEAGDQNVAKFFMWDGLHLNADGYALWNRDIKTALGLPVAKIDYLGFGDAGEYTSSSAWVAKDGYIENIGKGESALYIKDLNHTQFYAEASFTVMGKNDQNDEWPKIGMSLKGSTTQLYWFLDARNLDTARPTDFLNTWGTVVTRPIKSDWLWGETPSYFNYGGSYNKGDYLKLSVAKVENDIFFYADGVCISHITSPFLADEIISANILNHNLNTRAKDATIITEPVALQAKFDELKIAPKATDKVLDGDLSDWTAKEKEGRWVVPATNGRSATAYAVMRDDGVYIAYDVYHANNPTTGGNWSEITNIEFTLGNKDHRHFNIMGDKVNIDSVVFKQKKGDTLWHSIFEAFVPYTMLPGYSKSSSSIPIDFAFKSMETGALYDSNSQWWFAVGAHPYENNTNRVTRNGYNAAIETAIDGDISDWSDTLTEKTIVDNDDGTTAKIKAYTADDGLYVYLTATSTNGFNNNVGSGNWAENANLEVFAGNQAHSTKAIIFNNSVATCTNGAAAAFVIDDKTIIVEVFIPSYAIPNWNSTTKETTLRIGYCLNGWRTTTIWDNATPAKVNTTGFVA